MKVQGSCHCGRITYEAEVDPGRSVSATAPTVKPSPGPRFEFSVPAPADTYRLLTGEPKIYVRIAESGARRRHSFCSNCGAPVSATADIDNPPTYSLRVGCLRQRAQLPPKKRIWCRSALAWAQDVSDL